MAYDEGVFRRLGDEVARLLAATVVVRTAAGHVLHATGDDSRVVGDPISVACSHGEVQVFVDVYDACSVSADIVDRIVSLAIYQVTLIERVQNCSQTKDRFIRDLLHGHVPDDPESYRLGEILGIDISRPRSVLLISNVDTYEENGPESAFDIPTRARDVMAAVASFFRLRNGSICGYLGGGEIAILKACSPQDLADWTRKDQFAAPAWPDLDALKRAATELHASLRRFPGDLHIAVGRYHEGLQGLRRSYDDCELALRLGATTGPGGVHSLDDLGLTAFVGLSDDATKRSLAQRLLLPLRTDSDLLPTLQAYFEEDCNVAQTASRLLIHRNTLGYRLDKITELCRLNPRVFRDAVQLRVAIELICMVPDKPYA